jgi:nucleotide-binding universal stress UspA family protein
MFQQVVVPVDGSRASFDAVPVAARMAAAVDGKVEVVMVVDRLADVALARDEIARGIDRLGALPVEPVTQVLARDSVAAALSDHVESLSGATIVMSSHGHGRTAAVLGNTADELLRRMFGPIVVVGPHASAASGALDGDYVVPLDGSERAETILPIVASWAVEFGGVPWIVEVVDQPPPATADVLESSYAARRAHEMQQQTGSDTEFDTLHGVHPARAICDFTEGREASLIFLSTHGRSGLDRLRLGSVAAEVVRHSSCPVVLYRPPELLS